MLSESKRLSNEITAKQLVAEQTEQQIEVTRDEYSPLSFYTAQLFFCIQDLSSVRSLCVALGVTAWISGAY